MNELCGAEVYMPKYKIHGYENGAYIVFEYGAGGAIYVYRGYIRGNVIKLYPHHSLCKGLKRGKIILPITEVKH